MTEKLNRREFISLNWESTIGFLGNFIAPQMEIERTFFRPPGALGELGFLTSCTRCGKCQEICPEQSIRMFSLQDGAKLVNTPFLDPNISPCTFCKKCVVACPTDALNETDFEARRFLGYVKVKPGFCLAYNSVMCDYCVRACPVKGAIQLENGVPVVSREQCTGCGICVSKCIAERNGLKVMLREN